MKNGLNTKKLENFENIETETICLESTISSKKWFIAFGYRLTKNEENDKILFEVLQLTEKSIGIEPDSLKI